MFRFMNESGAYRYVRDVREDDSALKSYFALARRSFGLELEKWHQSGYWGDGFVPSAILYNDEVVSSVAACRNEVRYQDQQKVYVQISTVMTLTEHRNKGLSKVLMEKVLQEWKDKCDAIYLLANDSVVDFYPKFGFEACKEYQFSKPLQYSSAAVGMYRKLNLEDPADWEILVAKYRLNNPFSAYRVHNPDLLTFHCMMFHEQDVYYAEKYDAVVIACREGDQLLCLDIFAKGGFAMDDLLGDLADEHTNTVCLGFTPAHVDAYTVSESQEEDTTLFVLKGKENVFQNGKLMFPLLSRA